MKHQCLMVGWWFNPHQRINIMWSCDNNVSMIETNGSLSHCPMGNPPNHGNEFNLWAASLMVPFWLPLTITLSGFWAQGICFINGFLLFLLSMGSKQQRMVPQIPCTSRCSSLHMFALATQRKGHQGPLENSARRSVKCSKTLLFHPVQSSSTNFSCSEQTLRTQFWTETIRVCVCASLNVVSPLTLFRHRWRDSSSLSSPSWVTKTSGQSTRSNVQEGLRRFETTSSPPL